MSTQAQRRTSSRPTACSAKGVDLNSLRETLLPTIIFKPAIEHGSPIVVLKALNPLGTCMILKEWLIKQLGPFLAQDSHYLRLEPLELSHLEPNTTGSLLLLEDAAHIQDAKFKGRQNGIPIAIFALLMPGDPRVRFFYIQGPIAPLLERLTSETCIAETARVINPQKATHLLHRTMKPPDHHCKMYTWMRESFLSSLAIPDHQDYANAMAMTDYAPFIRDCEGEDSAMRRVERCDILHATKDVGRDLSDDRYVFALHEAERVIAAAMGLGCGEYLLIKRNFFRAFRDEVLHSEKKLVKENSKVRTEYAHAQWLEKYYDWKLTRAKRLVVGWRELGLLEENRMRAWIRSGGQFEFEEHFEEE